MPLTILHGLWSDSSLEFSLRAAFSCSQFRTLHIILFSDSHEYTQSHLTVCQSHSLQVLLPLMLALTRRGVLVSHQRQAFYPVSEQRSFAIVISNELDSWFLLFVFGRVISALLPPRCMDVPDPFQLQRVSLVVLVISLCRPSNHLYNDYDRRQHDSHFTNLWFSNTPLDIV
jgi:hypothetical protein